MSANPYYLAQGYTPQYRYQKMGAAGTMALWTPTTSARVVLTGLVISSNLGGSITLGWSYSSGGKQIMQFSMGASSMISPVLGAIEGTAVDGVLWIAASQAGTDGVTVTATGFELYS